jgi:hypothetical protein
VTFWPPCVSSFVYKQFWTHLLFSIFPCTQHLFLLNLIQCWIWACIFTRYKLSAALSSHLFTAIFLESSSLSNSCAWNAFLRIKYGSLMGARSRHYRECGRIVHTPLCDVFCLVACVCGLALLCWKKMSSLNIPRWILKIGSCSSCSLSRYHSELVMPLFKKVIRIIIPWVTWTFQWVVGFWVFLLVNIFGSVPYNDTFLFRLVEPAFCHLLPYVWEGMCLFRCHSYGCVLLGPSRLNRAKSISIPVQCFSL